MIKISILYPNSKGARFDIRYYVETHMPLAVNLLSAHPGFKSVTVDRGLGGLATEADATYVAACHFLFDSTESFTTAFTPHAAVLQGDIPNYTNVEPVIEVNEVVYSR